MALIALLSFVERLIATIFPKTQTGSSVWAKRLFVFTVVVLFAMLVSGWWVVNPLVGLIAVAVVFIQSTSLFPDLNWVYSIVPEFLRGAWEWLSTWGVVLYLILVFLDKIF